MEQEYGNELLLGMRLSSESLKKFRLDPAPVIEDSTITIYHERTQALMPEDQDKIHAHIPFGHGVTVQRLFASSAVYTEVGSCTITVRY